MIISCLTFRDQNSFRTNPIRNVEFGWRHILRYCGAHWIGVLVLRIQDTRALCDSIVRDLVLLFRYVSLAGWEETAREGPWPLEYLVL
mgnify:CR=1 FL=1|jgi:hypothetical protein